MRRISSVFPFLLLLAAGQAFAGPAPKVHDTTTTLSCTPDPVVLDATTTCTLTVTDIGGDGGPISPPEGTASFATGGTGNFSPTSCTLVASTADSSSCSISYTPTGFDGGSHLLTASYGGGANPAIGPGLIWNPSSGNYSLTMAYPAPTISSISPSTGLRGDTVNVTVSGSGFVSGGTTLNFGADITQSNFTVVSSTEISVDLTIAVSAATGPRDVSVTNPAPGGGSNTLVDGFTVANPLPVLSSLSPSAAEAGSGAVSVTINGSGFVPESVAYFDGTARSTAFVNSSQLIMDLSAADTATPGDYPVTVVNPAPGGGTSNTLLFSVTVSGGSFDVVETGSNVGDPLYTKLHATAFSVDLLATDVGRTAIDSSFTGTVKVELLNAADDSAALDSNGCRSSWTVAETLPDQEFVAGDNGRITVTHSYGAALRIARFRVTYPASGAPEKQGCSSDAFSIRPTALSLLASLNNGSTAGAPVEAAGNSFTMTASATAGYDGTPQVDATLLEAHSGAVAIGSLTGSFDPADPASGEASGSFSYSEVGAFRFSNDIDGAGIHDDSFTAVDQPGDCTDDFSNTQAGGLYGCKFGNTATTQWVGRFTPHHFDVSVTDACSDAGGFSYSGQPFDSFTIHARNASGNTTQNFDYMSGDLVDDNNYSNDVTLSFDGSSAEFSPSSISFMDFDAGTFGVVTPIDVSYTFADAETAYTEITPRATDTDGISSDGFLEESTEVRSGRLLVGNTTAITTTDADVGFAVQTWQDDGTGVLAWSEHADDTSCTDLAQADFVLENHTASLDPGETSITAFSYTAPSGVITLGAPGGGNAGSVDIRADLSASTWLRFDTDADGTKEDAVGTVRFFEIFATEEGFINRQEIIN